MTKHDFRFKPEDHERMKATLDSLSDNPTEEEAEAVLQACGTSGKEVVNEFIERLLKENLELKQELARRAAVTAPRGDNTRLDDIRRWSRVTADMERVAAENHISPMESKNEKRLREDIDYLLGLLPAAAPADNEAESLKLLRTSAVLCISGDGQPRVSLLFKELKDAQAVHGWLVRLVHGTSTTTTKGGR